jgi:hypothetical protein
MAKLKTALSGIAIAALLTGLPAMAGDAVVLNEQINLSDVVASFDVQVLNVDGDVVASSGAYGNVTSALNENGSLGFTSTQTRAGLTTSTTSVDANLVSGDINASSAAYANTATSDTCCGTNTASITQTTAPGADTFATTTVRGTAVTTNYYVSTVAAANTAGIGVSNGDMNAYVNQTSNARVNAVADADMCCNTDSGLVTAVAAGNSLSGSTYTATSYVDFEQRSLGQDVVSSSETYAVTGSNVTGISNAAGNTVVFKGEYGYSDVAGYQENRSYIQSQTYVNLDNGFGNQSAVSYGVGNSALLSNLGSDARLDVTQNNFNGVYSYSEMTAGNLNGGAGYASATAIGNAATNSVCTTCGSGAPQGQSLQYNYNPVTAVARVSSPGSSGSVGGSAVAVGNLSTFKVTNGGH